MKQLVVLLLLLFVSSLALESENFNGRSAGESRESLRWYRLVLQPDGTLWLQHVNSRGILGEYMADMDTDPSRIYTWTESEPSEFLLLREMDGVVAGMTSHRGKLIALQGTGSLDYLDLFGYIDLTLSDIRSGKKEPIRAKRHAPPAAGKKKNCTCIFCRLGLSCSKKVRNQGGTRNLYPGK